MVVEPGARVPITRRAREATVTLLSVATLHPGKGHEILLNALAPLSHLDWRLVCAGSRRSGDDRSRAGRAGATRP